MGPSGRSITAAVLATALAAPAGAIEVAIDSQANGSYVAGGWQYLLPGTVAQPYNPVQITLDAGSYTITNAASTGYDAAWNYNSAGQYQNATFDWVWAFMMAEHGGNIIIDAWVDAPQDSAAGVAGATGVATYNGNELLAATSTAGYTVGFTLDHATTLDFYVDDYNWGLGDNYGGVLLEIQAVPEPAPAMLLCVGLAGFGVWLRGRRR